MSPCGDGGGEEDLYHVHSGGYLVTHVNSGEWEGEEDLCHVCGGGRSVTDVPSGGWGRRGGSLTCTQLRTLRDTVEDGGGEEELDHIHSWGCSVTHVPSGNDEKRICAMYTVGDAH